MKPVRLAWQVFAALVLLVLVVGMIGCATERYLSAEQDAEFRRVCEPQGCEVIPRPMWRQIESILKALGKMVDS